MDVLLLGCGLQGKAVLYDLCQSKEVEKIICIDNNPNLDSDFKRHLNMDKISIIKQDVTEKEKLVSLMKKVDIVIDVLPAKFLSLVSEAVLEAGVSVVNTMYNHMMPEGLHKKAQDRGITVLPEVGLDPGIDLILCGSAVRELDEVYELYSYCGGVPEKDAIDNPLNYKITWTWEGVLLSYKRPARMIIDGKVVNIDAKDQHAEEWVGELHFPGVGRLETIPNGDAVFFTDALGVTETIKNTGRYSMRWPGHSEFWRKLVNLGFLSDAPLEGTDCELTPFKFMVKHLEKQLQYRDDERDIVVMRNIIGGIKNGREVKIIYDLVDRRDIETGLFAMNRTVGYTASIAAQMIVRGDIRRKGLLTAVRDIPCNTFLKELSKRGIQIRKTIEVKENL